LNRPHLPAHNGLLKKQSQSAFRAERRLSSQPGDALLLKIWKKPTVTLAKSKPTIIAASVNDNSRATQSAEAAIH
jgi:hypothetical protein